MNINDDNEEEIKDDSNKSEDKNNLLKYEIFNMIQTKRDQLIMKKKIIMHLSNKLINSEVNLIDESLDNLSI